MQTVRVNGNSGGKRCYLRPKKTKCSRSWEINGESSAAVPIAPQKSRARGVLAQVHAVLHLRRCLHANQPCPARSEGGPEVRASIFQCSLLTRGAILKKDFTRGLLISIETGCYFSYLPMNASPYWLSFLLGLATILSSCCSPSVSSKQAIHT